MTSEHRDEPTGPEGRDLTPEQMKQTKGGKTKGGSGGPGGDLRLDEVTFTKQVDKASPKLQPGSCTGSAHGEVDLNLPGRGKG